MSESVPASGSDPSQLVLRARPSLAGRALAAVALLVGFYVLALGVAALLLFLPYAEGKVSGHISGRLLIFCVIGAGVIVWSILPRPDRFVAPGPLLKASDHPELFGLINAVAAETGQQPPAEVYLLLDVNAWVMQRGGILGLGSRRVMGVGLPLLYLLTVSQLRAVLAHEFGHYYGGDTRLGPWIYRAREAIGRSLHNLGGYSALLQKPFELYALFFLRTTQAISRRQEFVADEVAARLMGARALSDGLRAIAGGALAFAAYWSGEFEPLLGAGFRPPLVEGFRRFMGVSAIAAAVQRGVVAEETESKTDPYDSHPALGERLAALAALPPGDVPATDPPALSLLTQVPELEPRLLGALATNAAAVQALTPITWDKAGYQVYLPRWQKLLAQHGQVLAGITPAALPDVAHRLAKLGAALREPGESPLPDEEATRRAIAVLGAALIFAFYRQGWAVHAPPGEPIYCQRKEVRVEPFAVVAGLAEGAIPAETWQQQAADAGIADLDLSQVGPKPATAPSDAARS